MKEIFFGRYFISVLNQQYVLYRLIFSYLSETNVSPASTSVPPALLQQRLSSRPSRVTRTTPAGNFYPGWEPENSKSKQKELAGGDEVKYFFIILFHCFFLHKHVA